jgi:hypothetical protein
MDKNIFKWGALAIGGVVFGSILLASHSEPTIEPVTIVETPQVEAVEEIEEVEEELIAEVAEPVAVVETPKEESKIVTTPAPQEPQAAAPTPQPATASAKFYTSSHGSAKYWFPESCGGWQELSTSYLKSFESLEALLARYPSRTKSPQCN